ncbi:MAG: hypothetical protein KME60_12525 [Cyanomargarita calcarea GSE-NOS-MK-12-04C]|jgi:hypothetical protein|uniref:Uncharacterized protein n=1 Tax=Cyanomargarita calcarea GSE-NOS-MK-12-04C TaxID=2839659 RepID=A0A951QPA4_9CYAN|nr:hypothetical protein [Cyanomargarita calcarea GSE-NOS-MK-12-04C]
MLSNKLVTIGLVGFSASILFGNAALGQTVNQEVNGRAIGPDTFVDVSNFTVNPTGKLNQVANCEARNNVPNIDPRCDGHNIAIYGNHNNVPPSPQPPDKDNHHKHTPNLNQNVTNGGSNTTVITPTTANSSSSSSSASASKANATIHDSGNSSNTNSNVSQGGDAKIGDVNNSSSSRVGDQKNQQSVNTGATNVSPSTRVKVDGDQYNNIQFGSQAPGTGGEAFSLQYRSACGTAVNYRQGFALKPKRFGGGGFGFALDISSTDMDTIEDRAGVQGKMDTAFEVAMNVVDNQEAFQERLNAGVISREEAETYALANCAPQNAIVRNVSNEKTVEISREYIDKRRTCTARGCN